MKLLTDFRKNKNTQSTVNVQVSGSTGQVESRSGRLDLAQETSAQAWRANRSARAAASVRNVWAGSAQKHGSQAGSTNRAGGPFFFFPFLLFFSPPPPLAGSWIPVSGMVFKRRVSPGGDDGDGGAQARKKAEVDRSRMGATRVRAHARGFMGHQVRDVAVARRRRAQGRRWRVCVGACGYGASVLAVSGRPQSAAAR